MSNPALFVSILIVCLVVPIAWFWWGWKERSALAIFLGTAAAFIFSVVLICWAVGASWQTAVFIICAMAFVVAIKEAQWRAEDAIIRRMNKRRGRR